MVKCVILHNLKWMLCRVSQYRPFTKCPYAECPYAECPYAECSHAECPYAECRGTT
jgi:hypothetical protein